MPKRPHSKRNIGIVLVAALLAVLLGLLVLEGASSSTNLQNLPDKQLSVVQDYVNEVSLATSGPPWAPGPSSNTTSYNWIVVIQNTGKTAITSVVASAVLSGNVSNVGPASCDICAAQFQIKSSKSSPIGQQTPLTSNERATSTQTFVPSIVTVMKQSPYPVSITVTYADGTQSTLNATAVLCQTNSCENNSGGSTSATVATSAA